MTEAKIYEDLIPIFQEVFDRDDIVLTPEFSAADLEEWDSLNNIRLFVAIEQEFGVRFGTDEITSLRNVGEMANLIISKRS